MDFDITKEPLWKLKKDLIRVGQWKSHISLTRGALHAGLRSDSFLKQEMLDLLRKDVHRWLVACKAERAIKAELRRRENGK